VLKAINQLFQLSCNASYFGVDIHAVSHVSPLIK